jgi:hypothetical protein
MATKAKPKAAAKPHKAPLAVELGLTPDEQAQVGFFASAVQGPHKGRYGVLRSRSGDMAVLSTRDANDENLLVAYEDLRPDQAGRR